MVDPWVVLRHLREGTEQNGKDAVDTEAAIDEDTLSDDLYAPFEELLEAGQAPAGVHREKLLLFDVDITLLPCTYVIRL